jgi:hypothetical protein
MSKSAVAAGLIGGRVGNKGGVGISLKLAGTTFLFLNAHLAGAALYSNNAICLMYTIGSSRRQNKSSGGEPREDQGSLGAIDHICVLIYNSQAELDVDTFLSNDDSRMMAEG